MREEAEGSGGARVLRRVGKTRLGAGDFVIAVVGPPLQLLKRRFALPVGSLFNRGFAASFAPFQLLRRLPIIMVEDAQLHPFFAHCVWLMAAHAKGFPVQESHVHLLQARAVVSHHSAQFTPRVCKRVLHCENINLAPHALCTTILL